MSDLVLIEPTPATIPAPGGDLPVLEIALGGAPRGLVVLLFESRTADVEVVEAMNSVAHEGYESLAAAADVEQLGAIFDRARERGWEDEQVGMIGIGHGGTLALAAAQGRQFGAAVSFSAVPDVARVVEAPELRTPWLGLFGAEAGELTGAQIRELAAALEVGSDVYSEVVVFPGVGRDFHRKSDNGISFAASYDGWQRTAEWLNARVAARLTPLAVAWRERQRALAG